MKRVRVSVVFDEVNEQGEVIESPQKFKFGSVTSEQYGPPQRIAHKVGTLVENTILQYLPAYLKETQPIVPEEAVVFEPGLGFVVEEVA